MLGNQSQNSGLPALPAPGPVTIDGALGDWDFSGRIWSFADINLRDEYSVETAAMWDADYLYIALKWRDPSPLHNLIDPKFNPRDGWKSDAVQLRVKTDQTLWITAWQYAGERTANLTLDVWKNPANPKDGMDTRDFFGEPGKTELGDGVAMAFTPAEGGYIQEIRLPWKLLFKEVPRIAAGEKVRMGFEYIWGDPTGKKSPAHRYVDNMQPGMTEREFFWTARAAWGDVELLASGHLAPRQYRAADQDRDGPVAFTLPIPGQARRFTVVIDDEKGRRVRNLVADVDPADFAVGEKGGQREVRLGWDGADDEGKPAAPGQYRVRGLWHTGLDALYDFTYYNPGTPPWQTADGTGAWGADHYAPRAVTAAGDGMIVSWDFAEGGSGVIGLGPDGRKKWGENRGSLVTAANAKHVFSVMSGWHGSGNLCRYDAKTGAYTPFVVEGKPRPFEQPLSGLIPNVPPPEGFVGTDADLARAGFVVAMAADENRLALGLADGRVAILDAESGVLRHEYPISVSALAFSPGGELYAIAGGELRRIDPASGATTPIPTPGLHTAGALAVNARGEIAVMDLGPDQQAKIYSPAGKPLATAGKQGGRPIRGAFEPQAMSHVSSIAFDTRGDLWAVENWNYPRRVSVWGRDGKLARDYIGNTGYSGAGAYLHPQDPTLAYIGPVELKLDRDAGTYRVTRILWKADETRSDEPKTFDLNPSSGVIGQRFRSAASGQPREYLFKQPVYAPAEPSVLFMEDANGSWRPVAAVGLVGQISGDVGSKGREVIENPKGDFAGLSAWDGFFWNDENRDGRVQRQECAIVPCGTPSQPGSRPPARLPIPMGTTWNNTMDPADLSYFVKGIHQVKPLRFTAEGAPVYGPESITEIVDTALLAGKSGGTLNPVVTGDRSRFILLQTLYAAGDPPSFIGLDARTREVQWTYPNRYPGVHASHKAPMPRPGLLIGPLKVTGAVHVNDEAGEVISLRGNLGQDFFFTTDGLNIGALFRDTRYPSRTLPPTEAEVRGKSLASYSEGAEPFSGWFGKQADGKIRMTMSLVREGALVAEIKGLDSIHRFTGPAVTLTPADLEKAAAARAATSATEARKPYSIARVQTPPPLDGTGWKEIPALEIHKEGSPEKASAQLASDGSTLYLRFRVTDASPMQNEGKDFARLFKTGDAVDLQLGPQAPTRTEPGAGDVRVVFSLLEGKPAAVLMRPVDPGAPKAAAKVYVSPVGPKAFDRVETLKTARVHIAPTAGGYVLTAALPWADLGIQPAPGLKLRGDAGFISSDAAGKRNVARTYWANEDTGLVSDEPQESWLFPARWGEFIVE